MVNNLLLVSAFCFTKMGIGDKGMRFGEKGIFFIYVSDLCLLWQPEVGVITEAVGLGIREDVGCVMVVVVGEAVVEFVREKEAATAEGR
ncbi:hypothetical protein HanHA300_Chr01g0020091 [Helianthus annuus]|nr:hypothetical protein HanHA300_Chr01g0020091 [Helianthus annuus]KAJ0627179.1 hypothetical protein HanHA89_Chr01g0022311 [Helianthus annuus]